MLQTVNLASEGLRRFDSYTTHHMNTKDFGTLGEIKAMAYYAELGYEILVPMGDRRKYDFVIEKDGELIRVQVKCTTVKEVDLRTTGGRKVKTAKKYVEGDFDELCVVKIIDGVTSFFVFDGAEMAGRRSVTV